MLDAEGLSGSPEATLDPPAQPATQSAPTEPAPADAPPEEPVDAGPSTPDSAEDSSSSSETPEQRKSRSQRQREREAAAAAERETRERETREREALEAKVQEILAERERLAAEKAERDAQEKAARERYSKFLGDDAELQRLEDLAMSPVPDAYDPTFDTRRAEINDAKAQLRQLRERREMAAAMARDYRSVSERQAWQAISDHFSTGATLEGVDAEAYRRAPDIPTALRVIRDSVARARDEHWKAQLDELKGQLDYEKAAREAAEARNGRPAALEAGGTSGSTGSMTLEAYLALSPQDRRTLIREKPDLVNALTRGMT